MPCLVLTCPVLLCPAPYCPILSYPTLPYPTLPYPTLPYPTLPFSTLPYPALSWQAQSTTAVHDLTFRHCRRCAEGIDPAEGHLVSRKMYAASSTTLGACLSAARRVAWHVPTHSCRHLVSAVSRHVPTQSGRRRSGHFNANGGLCYSAPHAGRCVGSEATVAEQLRHTLVRCRALRCVPSRCVRVFAWTHRDGTQRSA